MRVAALRPPGILIDVDGRRLHVHGTGTGTPAIVLEAALGASAVSWSLVQPELAKLTRVCSYDRAGFGWSDDSIQPRTAGRIADELRALLDRAGIEPPFVLVGHSFGGLVIRVFAKRYRGDVAGLVFVDPAHPEDWLSPAAKEQLKIDRGLMMCRIGAAASRIGLSRALLSVPHLGVAGMVHAAVRLMNGGRIPREDAGILAPVWKLPPDARRQLARFWSRTSFFDTLASQLEWMRESAAEALDASAAGFGDLPLVTISQTDPGAYRRRQQEALALLSTRGEHLVAANSGHWIPIEEPAIVVAALELVLGRASRSPIPPFIPALSEQPSTFRN
jgi:pimeloyl-ACP methyl ester carboxylesterase